MFNLKWKKSAAAAALSLAILSNAGGGTGQNLSGTIEALPRLIKLLQSKGYRIVTLPELLSKPAARSMEP